MDDAISIIAGLILIGLLSYLARLVRRRFRGEGRDRSRDAREAQTEAEIFSRSRLPF